jgi:hypothetical protein
MAALDHAIELVAEAPERWPLYLHETRRVLTRCYPFAVVYRVLRRPRARRRRRSPAQATRLLALPLAGALQCALRRAAGP